MEGCERSERLSSPIVLVLAALAYAGLKLGQYAAKRGFKQGQLDYLQRRARSTTSY